MKIVIYICTVAVLLLPAELSAFDAATHWYLGLNTTDVWLDYDAAFHNPSFYQNTYIEFHVLELQHFRHSYMKHFGDARFLAQYFSLVEAHGKLNYNN